MSKSVSSLTQEQKIEYNSLLERAKQLKQSQELIKQKQALELFQKAYSIYSGNEKLKEKIEHLKV